MEFILGIITGLVIGFIWGVYRATQSFIERIVEKPEEIRDIMKRVEKITQDEKSNLKDLTLDDAKQAVKIEEHHGIIYLYDKNDEFLAQGSSVPAALDAAEKRFPGRKFTIG